MLQIFSNSSRRQTCKSQSLFFRGKLPSRKRTLGLVIRAMPIFVRFAWPPEMPLDKASPIHVLLHPCKFSIVSSCSTLSLFDWKLSCKSSKKWTSRLTFAMMGTSERGGEPRDDSRDQAKGHCFERLSCRWDRYIGKLSLDILQGLFSKRDNRYKESVHDILL